MRQLTTEAETAAAGPGPSPDAEAALVAVSALDPKTTGKLVWLCSGGRRAVGACRAHAGAAAVLATPTQAAAFICVI